MAAAGSYADALAHGGEWHVRIDDVDPPRVVPGADDAILRCLEALGFEWQGDVVRQGRRTDAYGTALEQLRRVARVYPCTCSRGEIVAAGLPGVEGPRYPGTCRPGVARPDRAPAWRLAVDGPPVAFHDDLQGEIVQDVARATGDFVLRRADGVFSYHLACVVDDIASGFTHVVRGADLIDSTPRQLIVMSALGASPPSYLHLPVATDDAGQKLSKQTLARPVDLSQPAAVLTQALAFLGHPPPDELVRATPARIWQWIRTMWSRDRLPRARHLRLPSPS